MAKRSRKPNPSIEVIVDLPPKVSPSPPAQPGSRLTIHVRDDENITTYLSNLLHAGYGEWLRVDGRVACLEEDHAIPLRRSMSRREYRQTIQPAVDRFYKDITGAAANKSRRHQHDVRDYCFEIIYRALPSTWDPHDSTLPLLNGKPLTIYSLRKVLDKADRKFSEETHKNYARLFLLCRRFFQATPRFSPQDLAFLKRVDRFFYTAATQVLHKQSH